MVLSGLLYPGGCVQGGSAAGHRVQLQQQLAHYGHQGHFASFATLPQLTVEIRQAPRAAYRRQGRHVQGPAHHGATAPRMERWPCFRPLSRDQGASPTRAVNAFPSYCTSSGNSAVRVAAVSCPTPGPLTRTGPGAAGQDGSAAYALPARRGPGPGRASTLWRFEHPRQPYESWWSSRPGTCR